MAPKDFLKEAKELLTLKMTPPMRLRALQNAMRSLKRERLLDIFHAIDSVIVRFEKGQLEYQIQFGADFEQHVDGFWMYSSLPVVLEGEIWLCARKIVVQSSVTTANFIAHVIRNTHLQEIEIQSEALMHNWLKTIKAIKGQDKRFKVSRECTCASSQTFKLIVPSIANQREKFDTVSSTMRLLEFLPSHKLPLLSSFTLEFLYGCTMEDMAKCEFFQTELIQLGNNFPALTTVSLLNVRHVDINPVSVEDSKMNMHFRVFNFLRLTKNYRYGFDLNITFNYNIYKVAPNSHAFRAWVRQLSNELPQFAPNYLTGDDGEEYGHLTFTEPRENGVQFDVQMKVFHCQA